MAVSRPTVCSDKNLIQGELEHRAPKASFVRTNRKEFVKQVTRIERRQARLRRIKAKHIENKEVDNEKVAPSPDSHYVVGKSQARPLDLILFVQRYSGDPALKVCTYNTSYN